MKRYSNGMKATEFNRKQVEALAQNVTLERWFFNYLLDLAKYYGYDDNRSVEEAEAVILKALDENTVDAQKALDKLTEKTINAYGFKRSELDREPANKEITADEAEAKIRAKYPTCEISFAEEGCSFKFDNKPNAKAYAYKVNDMAELARKLRVM